MLAKESPIQFVIMLISCDVNLNNMVSSYIKHESRYIELCLTTPLV